MTDPIRARLDELRALTEETPYSASGIQNAALRAVLDLCDRWVMDFCDDHDCRAFREARRVIAEHLGVTDD